MKYLLLAVIFSATCITACKKEYNCLCTGGFSGGDSIKTVVKSKNDTRAKEDCEALGQPGMPDGYTCVLQ